jgi:hypothetical protein
MIIEAIFEILFEGFFQFIGATTRWLWGKTILLEKNWIDYFNEDGIGNDFLGIVIVIFGVIIYNIMK